MTRIQKIGVIAIVLVIIGFVINAALMKEQKDTLQTVPDQTADYTGASMGKVAASKEADGEYYVYVDAVDQNPEDTTLTMKHVTYFEGSEARVSAVNEVQCDDVIENCVPTLRAGYYVRESDGEFTAPLMKGTMSGAAIAAQVSKDAKTVFVVTLQGGNVVKVVHVTK